MTDNNNSKDQSEWLQKLLDETAKEMKRWLLFFAHCTILINRTWDPGEEIFYMEKW